MERPAAAGHYSCLKSPPGFRTNYRLKRFAFRDGLVSLHSMTNIIFQKSGVTAPWTGDEESILELGEENDLDLEFGCRMGNCTACQQTLVSGEVEYPNGHTGEPEEGNELLCCSQPKGEANVVIDA